MVRDASSGALHEAHSQEADGADLKRHRRDLQVAAETGSRLLPDQRDCLVVACGKRPLPEAKRPLVVLPVVAEREKLEGIFCRGNRRPDARRLGFGEYFLGEELRHRTVGGNEGDRLQRQAAAALEDAATEVEELPICRELRLLAEARPSE